MKLYVMDTDILGFAFQQHPRVLQRIQTLLADDLIVTTIITLAKTSAAGCLPVAARVMALLANALTLVCSADLISTADGSVYRLTKPPPRSSMTCSDRNCESEQMILPSPQSRFQRAAFCSRATL